MPYIQRKARAWINSAGIPDTRDWTMGELNYAITTLLLNTKPRGYEAYNNLVGMLECVKLELYRRAMAPYEDKKAKENGDLPWPK